ncbi:MAG: response regulator [Candidatus Aenigmarchaeota archaeon]|nr:response regulator [Candidatus Aenigmarchaeota archaeon]MCK5321733.1 response regulator [Candidatus Aenigmarchaeota archaeon]
MGSEEELKVKITDYICNHEEGLSGSKLSDALNINRVTLTKYLSLLNSEGKIKYKQVGMAKTWYPVKNIRRKVLIVDDEANIVNLIKITLSSENFEVFDANNGEDALEKVNKHMPDLIILDLMMPKMDGYETCKRIKENALTRRIPIIMLTAKGSLNDKLKGLKVGAEDYLVKPFNTIELRARVKAHLRRIDDGEVNELTGLPSKDITLKKIKEIVDKKDYVLYLMKIENMYDLRDATSQKLVEEIFGIFAKIANSEMMRYNIEGDFLGDLRGFQLAYFSNSVKARAVVSNIKDTFNASLPYLCESNNGVAPISLSVKYIEAKDAYDKVLEATRDN